MRNDGNRAGRRWQHGSTSSVSPIPPEFRQTSARTKVRPGLSPLHGQERRDRRASPGCTREQQSYHDVANPNCTNAWCAAVPAVVPGPLPRARVIAGPANTARSVSAQMAAAPTSGSAGPTKLTTRQGRRKVGSLHVVGTGRHHTERAAESQLRGPGARRDPKVVGVFSSWEDDVVAANLDHNKLPLAAGNGRIVSRKDGVVCSTMPKLPRAGGCARQHVALQPTVDRPAAHIIVIERRNVVAP